MLDADAAAAGVVVVVAVAVVVEGWLLGESSTSECTRERQTDTSGGTSVSVRERESRHVAAAAAT